MNSVVTTYYFAGGTYEVQENGATETIRKYYSFAGMAVAMQSCTAADCSLITANWTLVYFLTDHLGSVVAVTDGSGTLLSEQRYLPFGEVREDVGEVTQTDFGFTGQRSNSYINLMDYRSRWYDPALARFISPDSIIPDGNPQSLNRYSYVNNRPIVFNDPTGHCGGPDAAYNACWAAIRARDSKLKKGTGICGNVPDGAKSGCNSWMTGSGLSDAQILINAGISLGTRDTNDDPYDSARWTPRNIHAAAEGVRSVGNALVSAGVATNWAEAFRKTYRIGNPSLKFTWITNGTDTACQKISRGGCTEWAGGVSFVELCGYSGEICARGNVVHELGHVLDDRLGLSGQLPSGYVGNTSTTRSQVLRPDSPGDPHMGSPIWEYSPYNTQSEIFADFFVAWTFDAWSVAAYTPGSFAHGARTWMNSFMNSALR